MTSACFSSKRFFCSSRSTALVSIDLSASSRSVLSETMSLSKDLGYAGLLWSELEYTPNVLFLLKLFSNLFWISRKMSKNSIDLGNIFPESSEFCQENHYTQAFSTAQLRVNGLHLGSLLLDGCFLVLLIIVAVGDLLVLVQLKGTRQYWRESLGMV